MLRTMCNEKKSIVQEGKDFGLWEEGLRFIDSDIQTIQSLNIPEHQQVNTSRHLSVIADQQQPLTREERWL